MEYSKKDLLPIETTRLVLRLLEPEEAELMVDYVRENREHLAPWEPTRTENFFSLEFWQKELKKRQDEFSTGQSVRLAIFFKELPNGPILGVCNFGEIMRGVFQACFLGYSIHYKYQGQGIMFEALTAAVEFMFDTFKLHRIMANYMPRNERSGRLLKKLGFRVEGYALDYLKINGQWEDHILTAKLKDYGIN
ncbi:MAG: [ribosomal protein S5]-alanine N-acetyltransferase [Acidobacteriota bacterium]|nr:[ribosomal protein S5]-alanine N-acetyltransferase [Acidobacteriota bacterium]